MLAAHAAAESADDDAASTAGFERADAIIVRARQARQSPDGERLYLDGDLWVLARDWRIEASSAEIVGRLQDPDRIVVEGGSSRITVQRPDDGSPFEGSSDALEFQPRQNIVQLEGAATVRRGRQSISSDMIRYLLDRDTFAAGSGGRVRVTTLPSGDGKEN
ncbi:MAG: LptA/OstA family protein [Gammaproteobacteria bacterium]